MDIPAAWRTHGARSTDSETLRAELTDGAIPTVAAATAARLPQKTAFRFETADAFTAAEQEVHTHPVSHGELDTACAKTAGWLVAQGLTPGERVLLCGHNSPNLVTAYLAILRAGAVVVLANPVYTADELSHLLTDSGASLAFASEPAASTLAPFAVRVVPLDEQLPSAEPAAVADVGSEDLAMLAYTSGTTGVPKGVPLTHGNLLASIRAAMLAWRWREDDVLVHALPLSHQHGLSGVHATLIAGSTAVIFDSFDPDAFTGAAGKYGATVLFAVPSIYQRLVTDVPAARRLSEAGLRLAVSGSAPLSPELANSVTELTGLTPLERYGSTEAGLNVSNPLEGPRKAGTVGLPLPGVELRLTDEAGADMSEGEEGEILLRGPQVFAGYWNRPEETAGSFRDDGWFRTGDLGQLDEQGYLRITGRIKELIITGGMNVYPREVELALERHATVGTAAVAGLPSDKWGEQVTAWVIPETGCEVDPAEVITHGKQLLAAYKCPKQVFLVDSLPRNSMGKLQRRALVTAAEEPEIDTTTLDKATAVLRRSES